ncbi:4-pyridoxate dehydrogenase-like isoform X2 [Dermacentor albipictus]|uniref:4-pyridoxate dehydrogenase-like isoform X2 n=1 Tax=Dermacentor albipictus TaxID=60249 RepID=UPI0038FC5930
MAHHQLPEYDDQSGNWKAFITKAEAYFEATGVSDSGKKRALLLAALSTRTVEVLSEQVAPRKPNSLTYEEAVKVLDDYFDSKRHEIAESYRFFNRCQLEEFEDAFNLELGLIDGHPVHLKFKEGAMPKFCTGTTSKRRQKTLHSFAAGRHRGNMSGHLDALSCAMWGGGAAPQDVVGLLLAMINLVVHLPFTDLPELRDYELGVLQKQYDYVIVGGGSAGCVIANRLSADPDVSVLLLEAGGLETASRQIPAIAGMVMGGHDDWAYWTVPLENACLSYRDQRCPLPRGKVLGGSSVINAMLYVRGNRHDYDRWEREYGAKGWAYEDVLPHFRGIEDYRVGQLDEYHGAGGEMPVDHANTSTRLSDVFLEACRQAGYAIGDYNGPEQSGCSRLQANVKEGERVSAWKAFIRPIIGTRDNLHVAPFSQATKVIFEGSRAAGVSFMRFGELQNVSARLEVIVSAGAVGSAQLLLLSGVGPKEDLERLQIPVVADLPVGRSLQDHPLLLMAVETSTDGVGIPSFTLSDIAEYESSRSGIISIPAGVEALQFLSSENATESHIPNIEVTLTSSSPATQVDRAQQLNIGILPEDYDRFYGPRFNEPGFRVFMTNNRPKSRGHVTLRSKDPDEYPDINPGIFQHPDDIKAAARGTRVFIDSMLNTSAMKSIGAKPWGVTFPPCAEAGAQWSLGYIECLFRHWAYPSWHTCCTVPMGSHAEAVLDERLRVRGNLTGLRVADASVMPDIVSGNTNAPTMMIGSKAAEMIIQDNGPE